MGGERKVSKGGGYVGGFLQLFDWNAKSRKKLFSSKSDLPEKSKQKKRSDINLPITRFDTMDEDELLGYSSMKGSSDYSCASSVTDEEGYGVRAPGVVAKLMGLDSLPTSNFAESFSTPFFDSHSLRESHYYKRNLDLNHDQQIMHSGNLRMKVEIPGPKVMDLKPQKPVNRPIEKFQTEVLPPKSAKSVPITHHKLLSPIKSPGFIPSKNAAHIMEAAAKIIEPGPHATVKAKKSLLGTSSVPLKVRDLKEKVEAAQKLSRQAQASTRRLVESNAAKLLNGQFMNKSWNESADTTSFRVSPDSEDCSGIKGKGKSVSLAVQAKVNVQRREGLSPGGGRSYFGQKELVDVVSSQPLRNQPNSQKVLKKPSNNASSVLRQNNQKQNSIGGKEKLPLKSLPSQGKKVPSMDSSGGRQKNSSKFGGNSKVNSRKLGSEAPDSKREASHSTTNNIPRKKRSIDGNFHPNKNPVDSMLVDETDKLTRGEDSKRKGIDIVSFTFTTPIARPSPAGEISMKIEKNNSFCGEYRGKRVALDSDTINITKLSSLGQNMIGADALSVLLEQKLRELTGVVEPSSFRSGMVGNSASIFQDLSTPKALSTKLQSDDKKSQNGMHMDELGAHCVSNFSSSGSVELMTKPKLQLVQVTEEMDECSSNDIDGRKLLHRQHPSPISVLDPYFLTESCHSVDSTDSNSTDGSKLCSSVQAQEVFGMTSSRKFHPMEVDTELSDSASSSSTRTITTRKRTFSSGGSTNWELEYVKEILFNVELMFMEFALGRACEIINPHLFDQLETHKVVFQGQGEEPRMSRKVIFDCVSECVELRCRTSAKGLSTLRRKEWLAEEVYREISGSRGMGDCMVDDLVDKDMSSQYGKWLDFEVEAFELGTEIEDQLLDSLVDGLISDIMLP